MTTRPPALAICLPTGMGGVGIAFAPQRQTFREAFAREVMV